MWTHSLAPLVAASPVHQMAANTSISSLYQLMNIFGLVAACRL